MKRKYKGGISASNSVSWIKYSIWGVTQNILRSSSKNHHLIEHVWKPRKPLHVLQRWKIEGIGVNGRCQKYSNIFRKQQYPLFHVVSTGFKIHLNSSKFTLEMPQVCPQRVCKYSKISFWPYQIKYDFAKNHYKSVLYDNAGFLEFTWIYW